MSSFFDSVFTEIHPDLSDLINSFENLQIEYLPNLNINTREKKIESTFDETEESDYETEILSNE